MAQTINKYQIIQKVSANDTVLIHPETEANAVLLDNSTSGFTSTNVKGAIDEIVGKIGTLEGNVVTGVKGNSESSYRKGNVNITAANVGAEVSGSVNTHNSSSTAHGDIRTAVTNAQTKADSAFSLAEGRARAVSFDTVAAMTTALKAAAKTDYKVGDNLFIKATDTPDYWICNVLSSNSGTYGYFEISELETQKVDLSYYQRRTDNSLTTTNKTVVGAIGEVKSTADGLSTKVNLLSNEIGNIKSGSTKVGKSAVADSATTATSASKWTTARTITVGVNSGVKKDGSTAISGTGNASIDGSADKSITVNLGDSGVTAGTYSAIQVNAKGIAVAGGQMIEIGTSSQTTPSSNLATGGLFFKLI